MERMGEEDLAQGRRAAQMRPPIGAAEGTTPIARPRPDELRAVRVLADLAPDELAWIAERSELLELEPGDTFFRSGQAADAMLLVIQGSLEARRERSAPGAPVYSARTGDVTGVIPYSRMVTFGGVGRALSRARLARFPKTEFPALLARIPVLHARFVSQLLDRVRDATRRDAQFEKLNALGKFAAGLAHELNNPAAAVLRSLDDVRHRLDNRGQMTAALLSCGIPAPCVTRLETLRRGAVAAPDVELDELTRSDREESMAAWLSSVGVDQPWMRAPAFVDAGLDENALEEALTDVPASAVATALAWLETGLTAQRLIGTAEQATARISNVVELVKVYTNMDRPLDMVDVDVHTGLESVIALAAQRIRDRAVTVERDFAPILPRIRAVPGDLNQVWSNLLDNALDAVPTGGSGRVRVHTCVDEGAVEVLFADNGMGIPADLQDRVWEPFFTTKDVGQGIGLGLDIARRIVVDEHGGQLLLKSVPGDTRFTARLPLTTIGTFGA